MADMNEDKDKDQEFQNTATDAWSKNWVVPVVLLMLREWSQWLQADGILEQLPATLPERLFATTTHLNESGARFYTDLLAESLGKYIPQQ